MATPIAQQAKPPKTVFYSWQSDLHEPLHRSLIQTALERAVKVIRTDGSLEVDPRVDQSTQGVPGSPDIAHTIFEKIEAAGAFVADVSIINPGATGRATPNPNVLIELGYAFHALKQDKVVLVMNVASGTVESLPFDLRGKRIFTYNLSDGVGDKPEERRKLQTGLEAALKAIFAEVKPVQPKPEPTLAEKALTAVESGAVTQGGLCTRFMESLAQRIQEFTPELTRGKEDDWDAELLKAFDATIPLVEDFAQIADAAALHKSGDAAIGLFRGFAPLLAQYDSLPGPGGGIFSGAADLPKLVGHELMVTLFAALIGNRRWTIVEELCRESVTIPDTLSRFSTSKIATYLSASEPTEWGARHGGGARATLLRTRHETGRLREFAPWVRFQEGDMFLLLRSGPEKDKPEGSDYWRAWSAPLLEGAPALLREAKSRLKAQQLLSPLGVSNLEELREVVKDAFRFIVQSLREQNTHPRPYEGCNPDEIGTR